jgi:putative hydrolase of HD superfamily
LRDWWDEYEDATTPEARFANEIDRLQAIAQNIAAGGRTWEDWDVSETQARARNQKAMGFEPELAEVFELLFAEARRRDLFCG